tara:strand:- start:2257 stop:2595 length:339 start_codon:yes stop_codon:yes gene_type:complete
MCSKVESRKPPGAGSYFGGVALQQALVNGSLNLDLQANPKAFLVDQADHPLELGRIGELVLSLAQEDADQPTFAGQCFQGVTILKLQLVAFLHHQLGPALLAIRLPSPSHDC